MPMTPSLLLVWILLYLKSPLLLAQPSQVNDGGEKLNNDSIRTNCNDALMDDAVDAHASHSSASVKRALQQDYFETIYINAGSKKSFNDGFGNVWEKDKYYKGGKTYSTNEPISGTTMPTLYQTERYGESFQYDIPIPPGTYLVTLHFADIFDLTHGNELRVFDVYMQDELVIDGLDLYKQVGDYAAWTFDTIVTVNNADTHLSISFQAQVENAKISAIEVSSSSVAAKASKPHYAHAVPGGPYFQVDTNQNGYEKVTVDGTFSHTHREGANLVRWTWTVEDTDITAQGEVTSLQVPVGEYNLILEVEDDGGDVASDYTTLQVEEYGYPDVKAVVPNMGSVDGGETVVITGSGFTYSAFQTTVHFGSAKLSGNTIKVKDSETIEVSSTPSKGSQGMVELSVETPKGRSNAVSYTYKDGTLPPVEFTTGFVLKKNIKGTCLAFGPDGRLYIGTSDGEIVRLTLDDEYKVVDKLTSTVVQESEPSDRTILGITFNPNDTSQNPTVYVSHSWLFHKLDFSYNGKISAVSGANLDKLVHVITGLPVSDHDHAVNAITFGDNDELYIQVGGNTNAGVPGALSSRGQQDEDFLSAATLVAKKVHSLSFDGTITYDGQGNPKSGFDVQIFCTGERNPFGIVLHSNGFLYGTDNGPNNGFGSKSMDCSGKKGSQPSEGDKLNLLLEDNYYGHPNIMRGKKDPRQCKWRSYNEEGDGEYTEPIAKLPASSNGLCEWQTNHFGGQLRGDLVIGRYKGELRIAKLTTDGMATVAGKTKPPLFLKEGGLDVTQGPDGTLFVTKHFGQKIMFHSPKEEPSTGLKVKSTFPRRGPKSGGSFLTIYGDNLYLFGSPTVMVGGKPCAVENPSSDSRVVCKLPSGAGTVDVVVTAGIHSDVFVGGYRYTNSSPLPAAPLLPTPPAPSPTLPPTTSPTPVPSPTLPPTTPSPTLPPTTSPPTTSPTSTPTTTPAPGVAGLVFVNSDTENDIGSVDECEETKECFRPSETPITIRADTFGNVGSIQFTLEGPMQLTHVENKLPYCLFADDKEGDYYGQVLEPGSYKITAEAFSEKHGEGDSLDIRSASFEI